MNHAEKAVMLDDLSISVAGKIKKIGEESVKDFPPVEFRKASSDFIGDLKNHRYAATMLNTARLTLDMLFLFLDMNQLGYDPEIATIWYEEVGEECFKKNRLMSRRVLSLFAEFTVGGAIHPEKFFVYRKTLCEELPDWCKEAINPFLDQKRREKKAASTVCMYRSAATRFCTHLTDEGITSFDQINAEVLKRFNLTDHHETAEGKNAYNVRIRKFLLFLFENGYTTNPFLGESLPCTSAPKTRVVGVLTDQETHKLENYSEDDKALGLRNRAIALLGLKMGLRGSDITSLRFSQINWDQQSIRFCQEKTDIGKNLPMPTEVGNAIYRYVTEGRPQSRSDYIFITHKAPYIKIGRSVCGKIIKKAFPDKQGTGFHITRKTFATNRFRNNCGYRDVAYLLGHSNTETEHKYVSLDEERMRMCPISLCEAGILMEGGSGMNKDYIRSSPVAPFIDGLIEEKRSLGFSYVFEEYLLNVFDNYCIENSLEDPCFNRQFLIGWLEARGDESASYHSQRISFVRQLALYTNSLGIHAYIPVESVKKDVTIPHIISREELTAFFRAVDGNPPMVSAGYAWRMWNTYRVIFRLIYSCGMRNSEACSLRTENVDLDGGILSIFHSKGDKDRIIYLPNDMMELMRSYSIYVRGSLGHVPGWFFPSRNTEGHVDKTTLDRRFSEAWAKTPYASSCGKKPTVHSLRHSFVVDRMNAWAEEGLPYDQMLPYLSKHLGHSGVGESLYYYHLNEKANALIRKKGRTAGRVIPGVEKYGA